jgi:CheY-like chemotaxis protein
MHKTGEPVDILMADDDADDRLMAEKAFLEAKLENGLRFVEDGEELMDYLLHRGKYTNSTEHPLPGLILLDLNMPRKDGREALKEIKAHPQLHRIPVVILTTSKAETDILRSYDLGVNSFITKPVTFQGLVEAMRVMKQYWFQLVKLPNGCSGS